MGLSADGLFGLVPIVPIAIGIVSFVSRRKKSGYLYFCVNRAKYNISPIQGLKFILRRNHGRCPWLCYCAPVGLEKIMNKIMTNEIDNLSTKELTSVGLVQSRIAIGRERRWR